MRFLVLNPPIYAVASSLGAAVLNAETLLVRLGVDVNNYATLDIFFRFQIPDFNLCFALFSLCHFFLTMYFLDCLVVLFR